MAENASYVTVEIQRRQSNRSAVATLFKSRPREWISTVELEQAGGRNAWRTRVSECRVGLGMCIENRQLRVMAPDGRSIDRIISEYRFLPRLRSDGQDGAVTQPKLFTDDAGRLQNDDVV